ncbi:polyphosphate--glucose phosphotransferase [Chloroflexota bacterium]
MDILGIDIGGSGIKGAPVDIKKGVLAAERYRIPTPQPSTPDAVGNTVAKVARHFDWKGPMGCTFPAVVKKGKVYSAANVDTSWIGVDGAKLLKAKTGCPVLLINDADAAGMAEMRFGAGRGRGGVVFVLTLGTGIGSAIFVNGVLVPNTELGHMQILGRQGGAMEAEEYASDRIRKGEKLGWTKWAGRVNDYLDTLEALFSPDLFILGGGVSKKHPRFLPLLSTRAEVVPAQLLNEAGIVGAALAAKSLRKVVRD